MKIAVVGLWHLGCVTAACCARHFEVAAWDDDAKVMSDLRLGKAPLFEPGLDALLSEDLKSGKLSVTSDLAEACADADICWVTIDTPVDDNDVADIDFVLSRIARCVTALPEKAVILISSQVPAGTHARLSKEFPSRSFAISPENLRLGSAIQIFSDPDRVIVGCVPEDQPLLSRLFEPFTQNIVWMKPASAEMTKHAINSFLALSITFMNELSLLCEDVGADAKEVERGLKSESRIGPKAYLSPGGPFAGGTLARDVVACVQMGERYGEQLEIMPAIKRSNDRHRGWNNRKLSQCFPEIPSSPIALLGLTYKPGTDTLRRSSAVELARALHERGFKVKAWDPSLSELPSELSFIELCNGPESLLRDTAALVVCTTWPAFRDETRWPEFIATMSRPLVIDPTRFLEASLGDGGGVEYLTVGKSS